MTRAYTEWLQRPESERNAEVATEVMGWESCPVPGEDYVGHWYKKGDPGEWTADGDWSPCTDRNATDMLLAEVARDGKRATRFLAAIGGELDPHATVVFGGVYAASQIPLTLLRAPASLLTWACVEACREGA